MINAIRNLCAVRRSESGAVVIETAIVLPFLLLLALGGFETSRLVSRNNELQIAISEAGAIVLARLPEDQADIDRVKSVIVTSTGLDSSKITLEKKFRCNSDASLVADITSCPTGAVISEFIEITIADWYEPIWTNFGVGDQVNYDLTRRVQIS